MKKVKINGKTRILFLLKLLAIKTIPVFVRHLTPYKDWKCIERFLLLNERYMVLNAIFEICKNNVSIVKNIIINEYIC